MKGDVEMVFGDGRVLRVRGPNSLSPTIPDIPFLTLRSERRARIEGVPEAAAKDVDVRTALRYVRAVIRSFADERTAAVFSGQAVKGVDSRVQGRAKAKLQMLDAARNLIDLRLPPGNRLEALKGDRMGQHGLRVNDRWRICFVWRAGEAWDVEIVDYHRG
jgi:proteic killer suppression protein